ncbi:DUF3800 domain-containing protein [Mycobacterium marseillense]|uniref:DUF3800 domain-containing protein n=1 Tax=Mycobacterium marseillense TaxID=701042 RepID=UPI000E751FBC|nr:DUF3800 domain-containing protein [Mycobacterium marseillense]MCA2264788.1 DUF3800 domain-containing protein [Mycobacterium marseillense]
MILAYVDETGDTGDPALGGSSNCYGLGCVLVETDKWSDVFTAVLSLRRNIRARYGIGVRKELKANYLIRGSSHLRDLNLSPNDRHVIYRSHFRVLQQVAEPFGVRAFGIVVDKQASPWSSPQDTFDMAWITLLQRLERTSTKRAAELMVIHDQGEDKRVMQAVRRARRHLPAGLHWGTGSVVNPAKYFVEDAIPRSSANSYFVQIADLVAYAAWRTHQHPSPGAAAVCPHTTWNLLGEAIHTPVTSVKPGNAIGVVLR